MTDPLSLLREYNVNKNVILEQNNQIVFGKSSWPKTTKTNYLVCGTGKNGVPKSYYTLECLHFLLKNVQLPHPLYVQKASVENLPFVRLSDREKLLAYLNGESDGLENIDKNASVEDQISEENDGSKKYNKEDHVPISLFREYNLKKEEIVETDDEIMFGKQSWPKSSKTNVLVCRSKKSEIPKDYYTLETVLLFMKNAHLVHPIYVEKANAKNIPYVMRPDRKKLLGYLNGTINDLESIDENVSTKTVINDTSEEQNQCYGAPVAKKQKL